jgi:hypothetical protein
MMVVSAVVVFFLTILLWGVVSAYLPALPQPALPAMPFAINPMLVDPRSPGALKTDNIVGLLLALLAALGAYSMTGRAGGREGVR